MSAGLPAPAHSADARNQAREGLMVMGLVVMGLMVTGLMVMGLMVTGLIQEVGVKLV